MEKLLLLNLKNNQRVMNVCIYSVDPSRYMPKCFLCPTDSYASVLQTCVQAAAIPSNVSYTQANCIEQNCAIRRGKRSINDEGAADNSFNFSEPSSPLIEGAQLHQLNPNASFYYGPNKKSYNKDLIIEDTVEANAMDFDDTELLLEYDVA
ncbi:hypothetical protein HNY73_004039 [Argiope bruennichi]|uniref:Uncharacterized protein n=1 Tax=Argiope bruennichi TaxID=94029 RepID=A0A8T0FMN5_ARGBR|nr:hypothetical protein HNY73_004039 [Argiope bruennichi]